MNKTQAVAVLKFIKQWLSNLIPGLLAIKVDGVKVLAKDAIGWRDVGQLQDFVALARAMGRI